MIRYLFLLLLFAFSQLSAASLFLREHLNEARQGDYVVTMQNKNYTLLNIHQTDGKNLVLEEITVPVSMKSKSISWKDWVSQGAPGHSCWVLYLIQFPEGIIKQCYSVSKHGWLDTKQLESFLPTLLNLRFATIPENERKKVGPPPSVGSPDFRKYWQPKMIMDGRTISGVSFDGWLAQWPRDESILSGKSIEIYLPHDKQYPSYFPYWLQIRGAVGKATIHIIDSGYGLHSPAQFPGS